MIPFPEPTDEAEASVIKVFKRKLSEKWANGLKFEITTIEIERKTQGATGKTD